MTKNRAAAALAKRRWRKSTKTQRIEYAKGLVQAREEQRAERKDSMITEIRAAHIPTWLKAKLLNASTGTNAEDNSYLDVGYHLGRYHLEDFCEHAELIYRADTARLTREVLSAPSKVLRRIFSSDEHPRGELTDLIPRHQRLQFLCGILAGADEEEPGGHWLEIAENN